MNATKNTTLTFTPGLPYQSYVDAGQYGYVNDRINEEVFPLSIFKKEEFEFDLFQSNRDEASSDTMIELMKDSNDPSRPWKPATIGHMFVYGRAFPEDQLRHPIVALGTQSTLAIDRALRTVAWLGKDGTERAILCCRYATIWTRNPRFLRVRMVTKAT